jgi:hypothetical protein
MVMDKEIFDPNHYIVYFERVGNAHLQLEKQLALCLASNGTRKSLLKHAPCELNRKDQWGARNCPRSNLERFRSDALSVMRFGDSAGHFCGLTDRCSSITTALY